MVSFSDPHCLSDIFRRDKFMTLSVWHYKYPLLIILAFSFAEELEETDLDETASSVEALEEEKAEQASINSSLSRYDSGFYVSILFTPSIF